MRSGTLLMKKSPLKRQSSNSYSVLMKKAVETFNRWIRERDRIKLGGRCYTCPALGSEAGHWRHNNNATRFNEMLVNLQCTKCNRYMSGNLNAYTLRLIKEHDQELIDKLYKESFITKTFNNTELREIIKRYQLKT